MARGGQARKSRRTASESRTAPPLGARPAWQGNLRLSLVSCPVALYGAISRKRDISFHLINPATHNRIRMVPTDPDAGPVQRSELVRGYEFEKNHYAVVTAEELKAVRLETTGNLEIEHFVDEASIERLFWNEPFYLLPDGDSAVEAYGVIRAALTRTRRVALGRVVMHTRERLMAVEPYGRGMLVHSLYTRDEVIEPAKAFADLPAAKPNSGMVEIAEKIIAQNEGDFDPDLFRDRYEEALRDLVRRKQQGKKTTIEAEPPERSNVIDLMDALKKSLRQPPESSRTKSQPARSRRAR